jgi:hypothetical protein
MGTVLQNSFDLSSPPSPHARVAGETAPIQSRALYPSRHERRIGGFEIRANLEQVRALASLARPKSNSKVDDFVSPSPVKDGKVPIRASTLAQDYLRLATVYTAVFFAKSGPRMVPGELALGYQT